MSCTNHLVKREALRFSLKIPLGLSAAHSSNTAFMGRQFKPLHCRRTERIELRLSKNEAHELFTRSINAGMSAAEYIRRSSLGPDTSTIKASTDHTTLISQLNDLYKLGQVLGQLVRSGIYNADPDKAALLSETLQEIKTLSALLIQKLSA